MFKNIGLKLISVLIAISLWFVVLNSDVTQMQIYVPVKLENIKEGYIAVTNTTLLNVEVKGSNLLLKNISHRDILINIDVSHFKTGNTKYKIKNTDIKTPKGIDVVRIEQKEIDIHIDKLIKKELKVVPIFLGEPKEGFKVESVNIYPEIVKVTGAQSKLKNTDFIETLPINISGKQNAVIFAIGLKENEAVKEIKPKQVDVFVSFSEDIIEESFENYYIESINEKTNFKYKMTPNVVKITLKGRKEFIKRENLKKYLKLYVDLSTINSTGVFLREINKIIDNRIKIISIEPKRVRLEVSK
jgi:hypothetical protein